MGNKKRVACGGNHNTTKSEKNKIIIPRSTEKSKGGWILVLWAFVLIAPEITEIIDGICAVLGR